MGASLSTRGRATDRSIEAIKRLLAGETVDIPGLGISGASISPRPPVSVEWWIGAGGAAAAIDRAARVGDAWYASPGIDGDDLRRTADAYREACGRHSTPPRIALRRDVLVGDDHDATARLAREVIERGYRGMDEQIIAGDVDHVAERMRSFDPFGVDDIVARTIAVDAPTALRSIELLGEVRRAIE
jgi:alkanesulfonate monooxygenase SsuD/methylene tetrahydromethanopterin reductase-like flavin-dependent oxidoreductase (luciferase family)